MIRAGALSLLLLACSKPGAEPVQPPVTGQPALPSGEPVSSAAAVQGEWRIAGIAGRSVDQPEGITASILPSEIHAVAGCLRWNWRYSLAQGRLTMQRQPTASPPCARPLTDDERDFENAMLRATFAVRRPDQSLVLAGAGGEVVMFRQ